MLVFLMISQNNIVGIILTHRRVVTGSSPGAKNGLAKVFTRTEGLAPLRWETWASLTLRLTGGLAPFR